MCICLGRHQQLYVQEERMIGERQRGCEIRWGEWKACQKCWLAAFVLLGDGKKGFTKPWLWAVLPKVGGDPPTVHFYWSGFRKWKYKKSPEHYRNGSAHFLYSMWYFKYLLRDRHQVLAHCCDSKSDWLHRMWNLSGFWIIALQSFSLGTCGGISMLAVSWQWTTRLWGLGDWENYPSQGRFDASF